MDDGTLPQCLLGASLEDEVVLGPPEEWLEWVEGKGGSKLPGCRAFESEAFWCPYLDFSTFTRITMGTFL